MRGLFLNQFYSAWNNLKIFGIFILLFAIAVVYTQNATLAELFPYITIGACGVSGIATMRKDTVSQWNRYELTLPIKRSHLVRSRYMSYLFWTLCGLLVSGVVVCITLMFRPNLFAYGLQDFFSLFSLGTGLAVLAGAIFFPLAIVCGGDKSEMLLAVSIFLSICLAVAMIYAVNLLDLDYKELNYTVRLGLFNVAYLLVFALSYWLSAGLYERIEL